MASWRPAKSLDVLLKQVNDLFPNRDKSSDGTIGDTSHASRTSDHNPVNGIVYARDITNDRGHGLLSGQLAEALLASHDPRIKYVIHDRKIGGDTQYAARNNRKAWTWYPYNGANPHDMHMHVSVNASNGDETGLWDLSRLTGVTPSDPPPAHRELSFGAQGEDVKIIQRALMVDGYFGSATREAVKAFQASKGLPADGIVGPYTWREILALSLPDVPPPELPVGDVFKGIKATVFGGAAEVERSAYDNHRITETELAVALPYRFTGTRPKVELTANGKTAVATIEDVGPWLTDDPYWVTHTRPLAETSWKEHKPLLRGPNKGRVANGAGIDLSPGLAKALGITSGEGFVDWRFV